MSFTLQSIQRTKKISPIRMLLHSPHKMGKSSFAAQIPGVIFIPTENGLDNIDTVSFPLCKTLDDFFAAITVLLNESHNFTAVCLDTADHLEKLIFDQVCSDDPKHTKSIADIAYGKGYKHALGYWHKVMQCFENLRDKRGMEYYILAHSQIKRFNDPLADSYDKYQIRLHDTANKHIQEIVDIIGFAQQVNTIKTEDQGFKKIRTRVETLDIRKIFLHRTAAYDAGCRIHGMPTEVNLDYQSFRAALDAARDQA